MAGSLVPLIGTSGMRRRRRAIRSRGWGWWSTSRCFGASWTWRALGSDEGGPAAYDAVLMFKILVLQTPLHALGRPARIPDPRPALVHTVLGPRAGGPGTGCQDHLAVPRAADEVGAAARLFARFDAALRDADYLAMDGQSVDVTAIEARRLRLTKLAA
jgi:hypothetical protein